MRPYLIAGIDIGNSQVKVVIAKIDRDTLGAEILGMGNAVSNGLRRGMVVDMEETIENVRTAVQRAEAMAGVSIKRAYLAVNGLHIKTQTSRGVIAVSRADNEISQNDIDRVLQAASVVSLPANREIIHVIPRNFIVDGSEYVKNPLGMKGVRLEADVLIIDGLSPYLRNAAKCVNENGIEVAGLVYAPLASAYASLDKNQKEFGVMNLEFGGGTSTLTVFHEADLLHSAVLPVGSRHITNDIAIALRTSLDVAERIKLEHAATSEGEDLRRREIDAALPSHPFRTRPDRVRHDRGPRRRVRPRPDHARRPRLSADLVRTPPVHRPRGTRRRRLARRGADGMGRGAGRRRDPRRPRRGRARVRPEAPRVIRA